MVREGICSRLVAIVNFVSIGQRWDLSRSFGEGSILVPDLVITGPTPECESSADFFSMDESGELIFGAELEDLGTMDDKSWHPPQIFESGPGRSNTHWDGEDVSDHMSKIQEDDLPEVVAVPSVVECRIANEAGTTGVGVSNVYRSTSLRRNQTRGSKCNVTQTKRRSWTSVFQVLTGVIPVPIQNSSGDQERIPSSHDGVSMRTARLASHQQPGPTMLHDNSTPQTSMASRRGGITTRVGLKSRHAESTTSTAQNLWRSLRKVKTWYMRKYRATKIEEKYQTPGDIHYSSAI